MASDTALIGVGVMGEAVLTSLLTVVDPAQVRISDGRPEHGRERAAAHGVRWVEQNVEAVACADVVIVAVKPKDVAAVLAEIDPVLGPEVLVVSIAAGIPTAFIESRLEAPVPVVRVMPNTPATIGQGVSVMSPGSHTTDSHLDQVAQLLSGTGTVLRVPESDQDAVTAISGSGPAYVFYLIDALAEAGVLGGLSRATALELATRTVAGAGAMAAASGEHPVVLREQVSSPAGTTVAGVRALDQHGVRAGVVAAVEAARARSVELGRSLEE
ncbi:pyrroline-5-carboxylate reductase [Ruania zhangjianzhongii]|uniref:pyrroline-5-carboxylate reductase n=1 Tax=Ruania zhangjianzhongii TaxID=2603206 RepID=UPI0011C9B012|nr:pyrroline-5-carboxylate reductase [Ruania zhangjianzhongii]